MLQTLSHSSLAPFLSQVTEGVVTGMPQVRFCRATFERAHYNDALFSELNIPFPADLAGAVIKRRAEYLAGRWCSQQLLTAHQITGVVERSPQGAPRWPGRVFGSISHAENQALAVAVCDTAAWRIGVDTELFDRQTMLETASEVTDADERALLEQYMQDIAPGILLAFSAKESLYKALWPEVQAFFGFDAASLVAVGDGVFTLELNQTLAPALQAGQRFGGCWQYDAPFITTLISERR
ncbi:4'-phosphopantetheinyl transferase superfamily protein [Enterobacteriaceae bacterium 4M9]|nr:4'-phosphopantetheinyl transferase superfamily protein [Enterobacteriaceae bacterium 4M9]